MKFQLLALVALLLLALSGCEGNVGGMKRPAPVATVEVTPPVDTLFVGEVRDFDVLLRDSAGRAVEGRRVEWTVHPVGGARGSVDEQGRFTAESASGVFGKAEVELRASVDGVTGTARVVVFARPARVLVVGSAGLRVGAQTELTAVVEDDLGYALVVPAGSAVWESGDSSVLSVSASGAATGRAPGQAVVSVTIGGVKGETVGEVVTGGYAVTDLGTLGRDSATAVAINDRGEIAGTFLTSAGVAHAFRWRDGVLSDLGEGGVRSLARSINSRGEVAGTAEGRGGAYWPAIWDEDGRLRQLELDGEAVSISDEGIALVACGIGCARLWRPEGAARFPGDSLLWRVEGMNATGAVVGAGDMTRALMVREGVAVPLAFGGASAVATAINDAGVVIGYEANGGRPNDCGPNRRCGWRWENGVLTFLGTLRSWELSPRGLNERGTIVGTDGGRGFVWNQGRIADLNALVTDTTWDVTAANGINEAGQIVGQARNRRSGLVRAVLLTPTAEK